LDAGVSAQAISKYERGLDVPSSGVLLRLARTLKVRIEYFFRTRRVEKIEPVCGTCPSLQRRQEQALVGKVQDWLERYLEIEDILNLEASTFRLPDGFPMPIVTLNQAESAAETLRAAWCIGLDPIENLTDLLEDRGIKVGAVETTAAFDACAFCADAQSELPVIISRSSLPGDRQRFSIARELSHLLLEPPQQLDPGRLANRFAGAFLAPAPVVRAELGEHRRALTLFELHLLKHKYGLSMQAWAQRALDVGILAPGAARRFSSPFSGNGWRTAEPGDAYPSEQPSRLERLVMQALAEGIISENRATELLGRPFREFLQQVTE
jgi:Zn-dependent peptidase ImmA (M78 family)